MTTHKTENVGHVTYSAGRRTVQVQARHVAEWQARDVQLIDPDSGDVLLILPPDNMDQFADLLKAAARVAREMR